MTTKAFLLLFLLAAASVSAELPTYDVHCVANVRSQCKIEETLQIDGPSKWNFVDANAWDDTNTLEIGGLSTVTHIPQGIFERFPKLTELKINAGLRTIRRGDFQHANELQELSIIKNNIQTVPSNAFEGANNLERINLGYNAIDTIEDGAFNGLNKLKYLILDANRLTAVKQNSLAGATNLEVLNLEQNQIETIEDAAISSPSLRNLILSFNRIESLPYGFFTAIPNLKVLVLNNNRLKKLDDSLFQLNHLTSINVQENRNLRDGDVTGLRLLPKTVQVRY